MKAFQFCSYPESAVTVLTVALMMKLNFSTKKWFSTLEIVWRLTNFKTLRHWNPSWTHELYTVEDNQNYNLKVLILTKNNF